MTKKQREAINKSYSDNALKMMKKRYLSVDEKGKQETPADMIARVAKAIAAVEKDYTNDASKIRKHEKEFFDVMANKEFTPAGRTMTNAGSDTKLVANCIVMPVPDSMEGIFQTLKEAALLQQAGAGLGFALDKLRPTMAVTKTSKGVSSGPVSFLKVYDAAFGTIKQQGRHGANMGMIGVEHPDFLDFISSKMEEGQIANFNISVKLSDRFMKKVVESPDEKWVCSWNGKKIKPHKVLRNPNGSVTAVEPLDITVGEVFEKISEYAWRNGEPGVVFIDNVNKTNPLPDLGEILTSNPCGEQFLHPYDNCNLGSLNLAAFVKDGEFDYKRLKEATRAAVRILDNVIDRFDFPVEKVTDMAIKNRRIGLGIMGFADMLYKMGVKYNSEEGYTLAEKVMETIQKESHKMSQELAKEKGEFPNWKLSVFAKGEKKVKMRNAALTTVAPTGSISMMLDTSSGLEPNFALAYVKQDKDAQFYHYLNEHFKNELENRKFSDKEIEAIKKEVVDRGSIQHLTYLPQDLRDTFVTSMDIDPESHVRMQATFQKHVDNSISKTINMPNEATVEDVKQAYLDAWRLGCKSCTVYRDGSRTIQVLNVGDEKNITKTTEAPKAKSELETGGEKEVRVEATLGERAIIAPKERPETLSGKTYKVKTGYGNLYITINDDNAGSPQEVFAMLGKTGGYFQEQTEAICRLISLGLRSHISPEYIIKHLKGIRGPMVTMTTRGTILSLPDAIGKIMEEHLNNNIRENVGLSEEEVMVAAQESVARSEALESDSGKSVAEYGYMPGCPECGSKIVMSEGCVECPSCGYSRCG